MTELDEHQQWEAIKAWWKENGRLIITVVVVVSIAIVGFKYWQSTQKTNAQQASILYDQLLNNAYSSNPSDATLAIIANKLQEDHARTPYASAAALFEAKAAAERGDLQAAQDKLIWVVDHSKDSNLRQIARLRLARVLLAENQPDQALEKLSKVDNETYIPAINLVKGDIFTLKNNKIEAEKAYKEALKGVSSLPNQPMMQYLQMQ
jgi:predicted negative regulator of RcsB-dependent stress response